MADGLPTVPDRPPGSLTPHERALPVPRVEQPQVVVPHVGARQIETPKVGTLSGGFELFGRVLNQAADEGMEVASVMAKEAGLKSVTLDADGNLQVTKYPIVGRAAESFKSAMQTSAVMQGEATIAKDMVDLAQQFKNDPEGFRSAAQAYRQEKTAQYEAISPAVSLSLGHAIDMRAIEHYRGMLNRQEGESLKIAASSIGAQISATSNELFAQFLGGKGYDDKGNFTPEAASRLQKITALEGQYASNPRYGVSKDEVDYRMAQLKSELRVADMQYRVGEVFDKDGPEAAGALAETIKTDPTLQLTPSERLSSYHRVIAEVQRRAGVQTANDKSIEKKIQAAFEMATNGDAVPPEPKEVLRRQVEESKNPDLKVALQQVEAVQPIMADLRKGSPADVERFLNDVEENITKNGLTPETSAMRAGGFALLKKMRDGIKDDPLQWASRTGAVRVAPIDWSAPDAMQQMRDRVGKAEAVAQKYGQVPTYLTKDEAAAIGAVAQRGGQPLRDIAQGIVQGFGDRAPRVLGEVSGESPVLGQLGRLLASGHVAPSFVLDASDAVALRNNPDFKNRFPRWADKESDAIRMDQNEVTRKEYAAAFTLQPDAGRAMEATAQAAYFNRAIRNGYTPKPTEDKEGSLKAYTLALQQAAGRTTVGGVNYGGIADYGIRPGTWFTSNRVYVPPNIVSDRFKDVIGALTPADVAGAVDAKGAQYAVGAFRDSIPVWNGRAYQFSQGDPTGDDPRWIRGRNGLPFEVNINALEPVLRKRVPEAYGDRERHSMLGNPFISTAEAATLINPTPNAPTMTPYERLRWNEREMERNVLSREKNEQLELNPRFPGDYSQINRSPLSSQLPDAARRVEQERKRREGEVR